MIKNFRIKWASKFGRIEHSAGRWLGFFIFILLGYEYWINNYQWKNMEVIGLGFIFVVWVTYLMAHTLEKKFYGHFGPRG